ncbi:MAG: TM1812 family CRISPR-associated protein [Oscillospiraceae bacterium]
MKKFISISPFQPSENMKNRVHYTPDNNPDLDYKATSFPIMTVINAYAEKNEEIEIITVVSDYDNARENYEIFKSEISELAQEKDFRYKLTEISVPYSDDIDTQLQMFEKLIDCMADEDRIYADITFGSKVMTQILNMGINYGYRIHKNVSIGCIVYGKADHRNKVYTVYDETSLNYMDEIVRIMAETKVSNPAQRIKMLLK